MAEPNRAEYGPFDSESEALATRAAAMLRAAFDANPGVGAGDSARLKLLADAREAAGVVLGDYDLRLLRWLSKYENTTCVQLAGMITRAFEAGKAAGPDGQAVEWGVRFEAGGTAEHACASEEEARAVVANMREKRPEFNAVLITRTPARPAGPWTEVES